MSDNRPGQGYEWVALSVTTVGALLAAIQGSALIIALPEIMVHLDAGFITILWVIIGYQLITTALVPVIGRLADIIGRKFLYNLGFAIFSLGSLLAGLSQGRFHGWDLILFRAIQGVGGALLFTNSTAIVTDAFRRGRVGLGLGVNQIAVAAGFVAGPVVGGLLTAISWRWVFLINVPLGLLGTLWGIWRLREPVELPQGQRFDLPGSLTFTIGLAALLLALSLFAFPQGSVILVVIFAAVALIALLSFVYFETHTVQPVLDPLLFRDKLLAMAYSSNLLNSLARGAMLFLLTFFLQGPYGLDPLTAGIMTAPFGAAFLVVGPISGYLSDLYGSRGLATAGLLISAAGLLGLTTVVSTTPYWVLAIYMILMGGGSGLFNSPNTNAIMSGVPGERRGVAAGMRTMLSNTGQMLSMSLAFPLVLSKIPEDVMFRVFLYGGGMNDVPEALAAFQNGLHLAFYISFGVTILAAVISYMRPSHRPRA